MAQVKTWQYGLAKSKSAFLTFFSPLVAEGCSAQQLTSYFTSGSTGGRTVPGRKG